MNVKNFSRPNLVVPLVALALHGCDALNPFVAPYVKRIEDLEKRVSHFESLHKQQEDKTVRGNQILFGLWMDAETRVNELVKVLEAVAKAIEKERERNTSNQKALDDLTKLKGFKPDVAKDKSFEEFKDYFEDVKSSLWGAIQELRANGGQNTGDVSKLKGILTKVSESVEAFQKSLKDYALQSDLQRTNSSIEFVSTDLKKAQDFIAALNELISSSSSTGGNELLVSLRNSFDALVSDFNAFKSEVGSANSQLSGIVQGNSADISNLKALSSKVSSDFESFKSSVEDALQGLESNLNANGESDSNVLSELNALKSTVGSLATNFSNLKTNVDSISTNLESSSSTVSNLESSLSETNASLSSLSNELNTTKASLDSALNDLNQLSTGLQSTNSNVGALQEQINLVKSNASKNDQKVELDSIKTSAGKKSGVFEYGPLYNYGLIELLPSTTPSVLGLFSVLVNSSTASTVDTSLSATFSLGNALIFDQKNDQSDFKVDLKKINFSEKTAVVSVQATGVSTLSSFTLQENVSIDLANELNVSGGALNVSLEQVSETSVQLELSRKMVVGDVVIGHFNMF